MKIIIEILAVILILVSCIITGNPVVNNDMTINIISTIIGIIFCVYMLVKRKKFYIDKQGIAMFILCISPIIPLIFNSYISLSGTVCYIFRYISILVLYVVVSYLINNDEKIKSHMKLVLIVSGVVLTLFGIDLMTTGITESFVTSIIGQKSNQELETRMFSVFLYTNTFAITVIVSYILSLGETLKEDNKIPYIAVLNLLLPAILLTQSRIAVIFLAIGLIIYFICISVQNKYKFIKILFVNFIFSLVYVVIFNFLRQNGYMELVWLLTLCIEIIPTILSRLLIKWEKIDKFITIEIIIIIGLLMVVTLLILSFFTSPLELFNGVNAPAKIEKEIFNVEPNKNYEIKLDIESISNTEYDNYIIVFSQLNKYSDEIKRDEITINECNKEIFCNIETSENIDLLLFSIEAIERNENTKVIIKSLRLNDKEVILNYKFLPTDIINRLKNLKLSQKSVWERAAFIKDGLDIVSENILLGFGGDCWRHKQFENQTYFYNALEMHCYIIQVFMEYGIIGFSALIFVLVITIINIIKLIKEKKDVELSIGIAFIVLLGHTTLDFDMTFLFVMFEFYILIAMLNTDGKQYTVHNLLKNTGLGLIILGCFISCYFNICEIYTNKTAQEKLYNAQTYEEKTSLLNFYIDLIPYKDHYKVEKIRYIEGYLMSGQYDEKQTLEAKKEQAQLLKKCVEIEKKHTDNINRCIKLLQLTDNQENKEFAFKKINEVFENHKYFAYMVRNDYIAIYAETYGEWYLYSMNPNEDFLANKQAVENLTDDQARLLEIAHDNVAKDIEYIKDYEKCRITKENSELIIQQIQGVNR